MFKLKTYDIELNTGRHLSELLRAPTPVIDPRLPSAHGCEERLFTHTSVFCGQAQYFETLMCDMGFCI